MSVPDPSIRQSIMQQSISVKDAPAVTEVEESKQDGSVSTGAGLYKNNPFKKGSKGSSQLNSNMRIRCSPIETQPSQRA